MKLFATLETSRGKTVSVSDNQEIVATVYDGNLKAYSVHIEWCIVGDSEHLKCNHCGWQGDREELSDGKCPDCMLQSRIETVPAEMGAIVTTREWRNQPDDRRKAQAK